MLTLLVVDEVMVVSRGHYKLCRYETHSGYSFKLPLLYTTLGLVRIFLIIFGLSCDEHNLIINCIRTLL